MENEKICKNCVYFISESEVAGLCTLHNFGTKDKPKYSLVIENWEQCYASQEDLKNVIG